MDSIGLIFFFTYFYNALYFFYIYICFFFFVYYIYRGFAFVEFTSTEEAKNAYSALENTHFYGRKLVIEWAKLE
jgi:hypothetical protein